MTEPISPLNRHDLLQALGDVERTIYLLRQTDFDMTAAERKAFAAQLQKSHGLLLEFINQTLPPQPK